MQFWLSQPESVSTSAINHDVKGSKFMRISTSVNVTSLSDHKQIILEELMSFSD